MAFSGEKADFRVGSSPTTKAEKEAVRLFVLFDPGEGDCSEGETPSLDEFEGLLELAVSGPHEKDAVFVRDGLDWDGRHFFMGTGSVVIFRAADATAILPSGVGVDHAVLLFWKWDDRAGGLEFSCHSLLKGGRAYKACNQGVRRKEK